MQAFKESSLLWPVVALIVGGAAIVFFLRWYYQPPLPPGNVPNTRLVAMFNERLELALSRLTPAHAPGLNPQAAHSARTFLAGVQEVTQHCRYQPRVSVHNRVLFDLSLTDGTIVKDLYSGGQRCPVDGVPGVPVLRVRLTAGRAIEITSDGSEQQAPPATMVPVLDSLIKHLISYDQSLHPSAYFTETP